MAPSELESVVGRRIKKACAAMSRCAALIFNRLLHILGHQLVLGMSRRACLPRTPGVLGQTGAWALEAQV